MNGNNALRADTDSARRNTINPLLILLEDLAARNDELEGRVHDLTLALGLDKTANVQAAFNIAETLAQVLILLSDGKPRSKEQLHGALYFRRPDVDAPEIKILDTLACKLRKCIRPFGVEIETIWSGGYRISAGLHVVMSAMQHSDPYGGIEGARRRRQERERERQRLIRAERGCKDRKSYEEQSLSRQRPWEALGVSRDTWERRRAAGRLATNDNALAAAANRVTA